MTRALLVLALLVGACTSPPNPVPSNGGNTGTAGAAPPPAATCTDACSHRETVCSGGGATCANICPRVSQIDTGYIPCVMAATGCSCCDANCRAAAKKK